MWLFSRIYSDIKINRSLILSPLVTFGKNCNLLMESPFIKKTFVPYCCRADTAVGAACVDAAVAAGWSRSQRVPELNEWGLGAPQECHTWQGLDVYLEGTVAAAPWRPGWAGGRRQGPSWRTARTERDRRRLNVEPTQKAEEGVCELQTGR